MPLIFKEKAETEMYALGIPIETAAPVLGAQYETHRPVDRPLHKATLRHLFERITRLAMLFHLRLKACRVSFELTEFAPTCPSPALKCKSTAAPVPVIVRGSEYALKSVIANLINNALRADSRAPSIRARRRRGRVGGRRAPRRASPSAPSHR